MHSFAGKKAIVTFAFGHVLKSGFRPCVTYRRKFVVPEREMGVIIEVAFVARHARLFRRVVASGLTSDFMHKQ